MSGGKGLTCQIKPPGLPKATRSSSKSKLLPHRHIVSLSSLRGQAETLPSKNRWVLPPAAMLVPNSAHQQETSHATNQRRRW